MRSRSLRLLARGDLMPRPGDGPKLSATPIKTGSRQTKGSTLSARYVPQPRAIENNRQAREACAELLSQTNLYALLGVESDVSQEAVKIAYRQRLLEEHPDKGGDQDKFDELKHAFSILSDPDEREAYDRKIVEAEAHARLVQGGPAPARQGAEIDAAARLKTAPQIGSKRQKDWHKHAAEWVDKTRGSAALDNIVFAIKDAAGPLSQKDEKEMLKDQTEALYKQFIAVPVGSRQKWLESLRGPHKQALKTYAKAQQANEMEKAKKWLGK